MHCEVNAYGPDTMGLEQNTYRNEKAGDAAIVTESARSIALCHGVLRAANSHSLIYCRRYLNIPDIHKLLS